VTCARLFGATLFAGIAWLVLPSPAAAPRVVVSYSPAPFTLPVLDVINLGTGVVESREPVSALSSVSSPVFTSDGRFLLFRIAGGVSVPSSLELRDLLTGFRAPINLDFVPRRAHPRRLAVYGLTPGGVARLDAAGLRAYDTCNGSPREVELTVDGSRILVLCASGNVESVDEITGRRLAVVAAGLSAESRGLAANADGSQVLVARDGPGGVIELVLFDVATGTEIVATPAPGGAGRVYIESSTPSRDAVVVTTQSIVDHQPGPFTIYHGTYLLDFATLALRRRLEVPYSPMIAISPDGKRAFVASADVVRLFGSLQDLNLETGQPNMTAHISLVYGLGAAFPPLFPPLSPTLEATVSGQRVTLSWTLPAHSPAAQRFVIHAGSRSGASDLGTIEVGGNVTSFSSAAARPAATSYE
jgi:hypothetical protein